LCNNKKQKTSTKPQERVRIMSWQSELPIIVRTLINDLDETPTYSTERLLQVLSVAAKYVQLDVVLEKIYEVDVENQQITPDPTQEDRDELFISLVSLKAACLVDQSTFRTKATMEGVRAALGPANISVSGSLAGWKTILEKGPCALYEELTAYWDVKDAAAVHAILSPFVGNKFDPRYLYRGPLRDRGHNNFYQ
jgi:hypothetical protein